MCLSATSADRTRLHATCMEAGMSETFDPAALAEAMAPLLGLELTPERRGPVVMHLQIAAEMAAKLGAAKLDDEAEPAPVFTP